MLGAAMSGGVQSYLATVHMSKPVVHSLGGPIQAISVATVDQKSEGFGRQGLGKFLCCQEHCCWGPRTFRTCLGVLRSCSQDQHAQAQH